MNLLEIAEAVDKLVMEPAKMQQWRSQVVSVLRSIKNHEAKEGNKTKHPWPFGHKKFRAIDPAKDMASLYMILAICHDDQLRLNSIITDEIKAIYPQQCKYPNVCDYCRFEKMLDRYLAYVVQDLGSCGGDERQAEDSEGEGEIANTPLTLVEFLEKYCETGGYSKNRLKSLRARLQKAHNRKITLPKHVGEWKSGQSKRYKLRDLLNNWPTYCKKMPVIPPLKHT